MANTTLLERLRQTPHLAEAVPRLPPEFLHQIIRHCGLEASVDLVALATPAQLRRVLDLDLWRGGAAGIDARFDRERFIEWLEALLDGGAEVAARQVARMDVELVIGGIAQHVRVFDRAARPGIDATFEVGGYPIVARHTTFAWQPIADVLLALEAHDPERFQRVMRGCRRLSNVGYEVDGLHEVLTEPDQAMFDLAADRDERHTRHGFLTAAQARAFLETSRRGDATTAVRLARAAFRDLSLAREASAEQDPNAHASVGAVVAVLIDLGIVPPPRPLLAGAPGEPVRLARFRTLMDSARAGDPGAYALRLQELAFLANALAAGCSIQGGRPLTPAEASDAAAAVCNLALERSGAAGACLVHHDLLGAFQAGWTALYYDVSMYTAERLIAALDRVRCGDRETQAALDALRAGMARHWRDGAPWRAREALDVITALDMPAWAALVALLDECPVMHAAIGSTDRKARAIRATAFEFISEPAQIDAIHRFLRALPSALSGIESPS